MAVLPSWKVIVMDPSEAQPSVSTATLISSSEYAVRSKVQLAVVE